MIEFKGEITGKTLKFYVNRYKKLFGILLIISSLFVGACFGVYSICIPALFMVVLLVLCPAKVFVSLAPNRVLIDLEDRTIVSAIKGSPDTFRMIDDIIEVKDYGEFYTFKFTSPRNYVNFIAQKDLITQGTIEEFEELFREVIVRV